MFELLYESGAAGIGILAALALALAVVLERADYWRVTRRELRALRAEHDRLCRLCAAGHAEEARGRLGRRADPASRVLAGALAERTRPGPRPPTLAEALEAACARHLALAPEEGLALLSAAASACTTLGLLGTLTGFRALIPALQAGAGGGPGLAEAVSSSIVGALGFLGSWIAALVLRALAQGYRAELYRLAGELERAFDAGADAGAVPAGRRSA